MNLFGFSGPNGLSIITINVRERVDVLWFALSLHVGFDTLLEIRLEFPVVNESNSTVATFDATNLSYSKDGSWQLYYQKRVIDAAKWVTEPLNVSTILVENDDSSFLIGYGLFSPTTILAGLAVISLLRNEDEESE